MTFERSNSPADDPHPELEPLDKGLYWHKCRECGALGKIDDEQARGWVSILCPECGAHYALPQ